MPNNLEEQGVQLVAKGLRNFLADMNKVNKAVLNVGKNIELQGNKVQILGFKYDRLMGVWRNASNQLVKTTVVQEALNDAIAEATGEITEYDDAVEGIAVSIVKASKATGEKTEETKKEISSTVQAISAYKAVKGTLLTVIGIYAGLAAIIGVVTFAVFKLASAIGSRLIRALKTAGSIAISIARGGLGLFRRALDGILSIGRAILSADIFRQLASRLRNLAGELVEVATEFQVLTLRFQTFLAREIKATKGITDFGLALAKAEEPARRMLEFVKEFSITNPVDPTAIANTLAYAQAVGFTAGESITLTKSIAEFTAAMGLGSQEIERILINFGQMRQQGKVTSTELRDLARGSLVPVTDILREMADMLGIAEEGFEDFREQASKGEVDVNLFFEAFRRLVERDFAGSLERLSNTWQGVTQRARNFVKVVLGLEVLNPLMEELTKRANNFLDTLTSPEFLEAAKLFGIALLDVFKNLASIVSVVKAEFTFLAQAFGFTTPSALDLAAGIAAVVDALADLAQEGLSALRNFLFPMADAFKEAASSAFDWGVDIMVSLAEGLIQGATTAIVTAMQFVTSLLTSWLAPGSPPRVAPGLIDWGIEAMRLYLSGFSQVDFDILKDIQKPLKSALDIFADLEKITKGQAQEIFRDISVSLAEALRGFERTGSIDEDIFTLLRNSAGEFGRDLELLLRQEVALANAIKEVERAQLALNEALAFEDEATDAVRNLITEYNALLRAGGDEALLDTRLAEINASEEQLRLAREARIAAEGRLEDAEDAIDPLEEQVALQQQLIDQLIELSRVIRESTAAGAAGGAADIVPPDLSELGIPTDFDLDEIGEDATEALTLAFEEAKARIRAKLDEIIAIVKAKIFLAFNTLRTEFILGTNQVTTEWAKLTTTFNQLYIEKILPVLLSLSFFWSVISGTWTAAIKTINESLGEFDSKVTITSLILDNLARILVGLVGLFAIGLALVVGYVVGFVVGITTALSDAEAGWNAFKTNVEEIIEGIRLIISGVMDLIRGDVEIAWAKIFLGAVTFWNSLTLAIMSLLGVFATAIAGFFTGFVEGVVGFWTNLYDQLVGQSVIPEMLTDIETAISTALAEYLILFETWVADLIQFFNDKRQDFIDLGTGIVDGIKKGLQDAWGGLEGLFQQLINRLPSWARSLLKINTPSRVFESIGEGIMEGLADGISASVNIPVQAIEAAASAVVAPAMAAPAMIQNSTVNMGGVTVNNGMDAAILETMIQRAVSRSL